jgi:hypothetical protein
MNKPPRMTTVILIAAAVGVTYLLVLLVRILVPAPPSDPRSVCVEGLGCLKGPKGAESGSRSVDEKSLPAWLRETRSDASANGPAKNPDHADSREE